MTAALHDLLTRVEAATGPSVEIDGLFAKLNRTMPQDAQFQTENIWGQKGDQWISSGYGAYRFYHPEPVTDSIDKALELVEEILPGWGWELHQSARGADSKSFRLFPGDSTNAEKTVFATGATLPLAILAALLKALIAQEATRKETA